MGIITSFQGAVSSEEGSATSEGVRLSFLNNSVLKIIFIVGISSLNEHVILARVDAFEDGMSDVMQSVGNALDSSPLALRKIGNEYWKYFKLGPLGSMVTFGSNLLNQRRRNWNRKDNLVKAIDTEYDEHVKDNEYEYEEYGENEYEAYNYEPGFYAQQENQEALSHWDDWKF